MMDSTNKKHPIQSVYMLMSMLGIDPHRVSVRYMPTPDNPDNGNISLAMIDTKVGVYLEGDNPGPLHEDGWSIFHLDMKAINSFSKVFEEVRNLYAEDSRRRLNDTIKSTSNHEELLLSEILKRGVPKPDRNYKIIKKDGSGKELTTPDFAWSDIKVAFFVDGVWWHVGREDKQIAKELKQAIEEGADELLQERKTRYERDLAISSELTSMGWTVLRCAETDLNNHKGLVEKAEMLTSVINNKYIERQAVMELKSINPSSDLLKSHSLADTIDNVDPDYDPLQDLL